MKMHSTIHLTVQYNTHLTECTVRARFILKLPMVLHMRVPTTNPCYLEEAKY